MKYIAESINKYFILNIFILTVFIVTSTLFAKDEKGFINTGVGSLNKDSNIDFGVKDSLVVYLEGEYKVNEERYLYIRNIDEYILIGSMIITDYGMFDIGLGGSYTQGWDNPFDINSRKKIDIYEIGLSLGYGFMLSENHTSIFSVIFMDKTYSKERVSDTLKRAGKKYIYMLENYYHVDFYKGITLIFNPIYTRYNADGKASIYSEYFTEFGMEMDILDNFNFAFIHRLGNRYYKHVNPIYLKTIESNINKISAMLTLKKPFGYEKLTLSYIYEHKKEKANVDFYNETNRYNIISIGYQF